MKVLIVGTFPPEPQKIDEGQFLQRTCENIHNALKELGHAVDTFDFRRLEKEHRLFYKWEYRFQKRLKFFNKPFFPARFKTLIFHLKGIKKMNSLLLDKVMNNKYDLVMLIKTEKVNFLNIDKINIYAKTWYYFIDWQIIANNILAHEYASRTTWASATTSNIVNLFNQAGGKAIFLTQGVDLNNFYPDNQTEKIYDVVFVGTIREERAIYINFLEKNGILVETFGKKAKNGEVFGHDLREVNIKAKIILNFNTTINKTGFSSRLFEAMACGTFLLTEYCKDIASLFKNKEDLVWFSSPEECLTLIRYYLTNHQERERIGRRGFEVVSQAYTWKRVVEKIIKHVHG